MTGLEIYIHEYIYKWCDGSWRKIRDWWSIWWSIWSIPSNYLYHCHVQTFKTLILQDQRKNVKGIYFPCQLSWYTYSWPQARKYCMIKNFTYNRPTNTHDDDDIDNNNNEIKRKGKRKKDAAPKKLPFQGPKRNHSFLFLPSVHHLLLHFIPVPSSSLWEKEERKLISDSSIPHPIHFHYFPPYAGCGPINSIRPFCCSVYCVFPPVVVVEAVVPVTFGFGEYMGGGGA